MEPTCQGTLPQAVYEAAQVRELDRIAIEDYGLGSARLMQRAAGVAYAAMRECWPHARRIVALCGRGNNGGDGLFVARQAWLDGLDVRVMLLSEAAGYAGEAGRALEALQAIGTPVESWNGSLGAVDVVVDAMLGTGLDRPVKGAIRDAIEAANRAGEAGARVLAIDVPSGISATTGAILGRAVRADVTTTFIGLKLGLYTGAGATCAGRVLFDDLGVPAEIYRDITPVALATGDRDIARLLPRRPRDSHKGQNGHVLAIGGDHGTGGAIRMVAEAALRGGAGLVSVATRPANAAAMTQARPELMCTGVEAAQSLTHLTQRASVLAVGPGLGQGQWGRMLWEAALAAEKPLVVDADALNLLARAPLRRDDWILTPHPGEAGRLLDCSSGEVQRDRPAAARALAQRYGGVAVLKGAGTLVCAADGPFHLCRAGNAGMATGGMGDLLCGFIASLVGQGLSLPDAARIGVYAHARAGDLAAGEGGERGLLPTDLLPWLRRMVNPGSY